MKSAGLVRRVAAFGASTAVLAAMVSGLMASPAQAATEASAGQASTAAAASTSSRPKVSVSTPKAADADYQGSCPVKVSFSAKIKVKLDGKTELAYRWLHGDGSKGKVQVVKLSGHGTRYVTAKQSITFKGDVKGWEAIQVLGPRKVTSKKGYFSVDCEKPLNDVDDKPATAWARAWASPDHYVGPCTPGDKIDFTGLIKVNKPRWVRYRWILNGDVVDGGAVKVWNTRKVGFGFSPRESHRGWAVLEVLGRHGYDSNKAYYKVWCKDESPVSKVSVSTPTTGTNHDGCKVGANANITSTGRGRVEWVWSVNGTAVASGDTWFSGADTKNVSLADQALSGEATKGGTVTITVTGPNNKVSESQSYAACQKPAEPTVEISGASVTAAPATCPAGVLSGSATIKSVGFTGQATWYFEGVHLGDAKVAPGTNTISFDGVKQNVLTKDGVTELKVFDATGKVVATQAVSFKAPCVQV